MWTAPDGASRVDKDNCYGVDMSIDPLAPRYYLEVRASTRADPRRHFYRIWENLNHPWQVRESGAYATECEARQAGEDELRHLIDRPTV
jgi:hypothetical protein